MAQIESCLLNWCISSRIGLIRWRIKRSRHLKYTESSEIGRWLAASEWSLPCFGMAMTLAWRHVWGILFSWITRVRKEVNHWHPYASGIMEGCRHNPLHFQTSCFSELHRARILGISVQFLSVDLWFSGDIIAATHSSLLKTHFSRAVYTSSALEVKT